MIKKHNFKLNKDWETFKDDDNKTFTQRIKVKTSEERDNL
jgi:hypothetical protein